VTATFEFCVGDMLAMNIILGLANILDHFLAVLVIALETARRKRQNTTEVDKWNIYIITRLVDGVMTLHSILDDDPNVHAATARGVFRTKASRKLMRSSLQQIGLHEKSFAS
jgi:hypothetical protein